MSWALRQKNRAGYNPFWLTLQTGKRAMTALPHLALQFARQRDAEDYRSSLPISPRDNPDDDQPGFWADFWVEEIR